MLSKEQIEMLEAIPGWEEFGQQELGNDAGEQEHDDDPVIATHNWLKEGF